MIIRELNKYYHLYVMKSEKIHYYYESFCCTLSLGATNNHIIYCRYDKYLVHHFENGARISSLKSYHSYVICLGNCNSYLKVLNSFLNKEEEISWVDMKWYVCTLFYSWIFYWLLFAYLSCFGLTPKKFSNKMRKYTNVLIRNCCTVFWMAHRLYSVWLKQILRIYTHIKS